MRVLSAGMTVIAGQLSAAVEAILLMRVAVIAFARLGLDRTANDRTGDGIAHCFEIADHAGPLRRSYYAGFIAHASG
jgi:hypothetical protein